MSKILAVVENKNMMLITDAAVSLRLPVRLHWMTTDVPVTKQHISPEDASTAEPA